MEFTSNRSAISFEQVCWKLVADRFEAKFHHAIWFEACSTWLQTGSKLVEDLSQTC